MQLLWGMFQSGQAAINQIEAQMSDPCIIIGEEGQMVHFWTKDARTMETL